MISRWYKRDKQLNSLVEPGDVQSVVQERQTAHSLVELGDDQSVVQERQTAQLTGGAR